MRCLVEIGIVRRRVRRCHRLLLGLEGPVLIVTFLLVFLNETVFGEDNESFESKR